MTLRFGDLKSLAGKSTAAELAADMLMRGTTRHTRQQIKDELDRLKARMRVGGSARPGGPLVRDRARRTFPPSCGSRPRSCASRRFRPTSSRSSGRSTSPAIEQQKSEPDALGSNLYQRHMNPYPTGDVRYVETLDESFAAYRVGDARGCGRSSTATIYGTSNGQLAVVGDFDEQPRVARPRRRALRRLEEPGGLAADPEPVPGRLAHPRDRVETPDKANAFFIAGQNLELRDDDPDYPGARPRQLHARRSPTRRGSTSASARRTASPTASVPSSRPRPSTRSGELHGLRHLAPQNTAQVEAAFREELARALKDGFAAKEIADAKSGWLQSREIARAQDATLARSLANNLYLDRTFAWSAELDRKVKDADRRPDRRRDAQVSRSRQDVGRQGGGFREARPLIHAVEFAARTL